MILRFRILAAGVITRIRIDATACRLLQGIKVLPRTVLIILSKSSRSVEGTNWILGLLCHHCRLIKKQFEEDTIYLATKVLRTINLNCVCRLKFKLIDT